VENNGVIKLFQRNRKRLIHVRFILNYFTYSVEMNTSRVKLNKDHKETILIYKT
jgi:hypothetical protein